MRDFLKDSTSHTRDAAELKSMVERVQRTLRHSQPPFNLQGTCHSYSDIDLGPNSLRLAKKYKRCEVDPVKKVATVQPGCRFADALPALVQHKLSFLGHGDFSGQTIIGAVSTATHGSGTRCPHNSITKIVAVNGSGDVVTYRPQDPEFKFWQIGAGALGPILEMDLSLVPDFNVTRILMDWLSFEDAFTLMHMYPLSQVVGFINKTDGLHSVALRLGIPGPGAPEPLIAATTEEDVSRIINNIWKVYGASKPLPDPVFMKFGWINLPLEEQRKGGVFSYNWDFIWDPEYLAKEDTNLCDTANRVHFGFGGSTDKDHQQENDPDGSLRAMELTVPIAQGSAVVLLIQQHSLLHFSEYEHEFLLRSIPQDLSDIPLSPFYAHRMSIELMSTDPNPKYTDHMNNLIAKLRAHGIAVHFHPGKTAQEWSGHFGDSGPYDPVDCVARQRIREFLQYDTTEDPGQIWTNNWLDRLHVEAKGWKWNTCAVPI